MRKHKLSSQRGETIGEALAALLIVCVCILMLSGAVAAAARVNRAADTLNYDFVRGTETSGSIKVDGAAYSPEGAEVKFFSSAEPDMTARYYYYEVQKNP